MANENQVTICTDFDETMVDQNTPIILMGHLMVGHPAATLYRLFVACLERRFKDMRRAKAEYFLRTMEQIPADDLRAAAQRTVERLTLKRAWTATVQSFIERHPNIQNVRFVIITRNLSIIPELFLQNQGVLNALADCTGHRFTGDFFVIGNEPRGVLAAPTSDGFRTVIANSASKQRFLKTRNAIFVGDKEDADALRGVTGLRNLILLEV